MSIRFPLRRRGPESAAELRTRRPRARRAVAAFAAAALGLGAVVGVSQTAAADPATEWLTTSGSTIRTQSGAPYTIKAVNWFGLETSNCTPHGLWSISLDRGLDQIASWGFNTIRLPYANQCLAPGASANSINFHQNPSLEGKTPIQLMDAVIAGAKARGLKVILDRHRPDYNSQSELWYTSAWSEQKWIADWTMLAQRYLNEPTVIGADLHNEPHGPACWGCGDTSRDWAAAATRAGNAILAVNPKLLIIVEGIERQGNGSSTWWGGGLADVATHPITLAVPNQLVYSPHDYPATVFGQQWFYAGNYPANLPGIWDANWGFITKQGIAPILLGEFGTKYETRSDQTWLATLVQYLKDTGSSFAYWSFNPNSGDTGGLLQDDWTTPQTAKLNALAPLLTGPTVPTTPGTTTSTPPATTSSSTPPVTTTSTPPPVTTSTPPPVTTSSTPPPSSGGVNAQWILQTSWNAGYVANFIVTPKAGAVTSWTVSWPVGPATSIANAWGMECSIGGGMITCHGSDWAKNIPAGASVHVGLQVNSTGTSPGNPPITVS